MEPTNFPQKFVDRLSLEPPERIQIFEEGALTWRIIPVSK